MLPRPVGRAMRPLFLCWLAFSPGDGWALIMFFCWESKPDPADTDVPIASSLLLPVAGCCVACECGLFLGVGIQYCFPFALILY